MKHAITILILMVFALGLGSNASEVRDRAFIQSIAISSDDDNIYTTIKLFNDDTIYNGIGDTLEEAINSAEVRQGKEFFTGHTEIVIFNQKDFSVNVLEYMVGNRTISPNCAVVCSKDTIYDTQQAIDVLRSYDRLNQVHLVTACEVIKDFNTDHGSSIPLLYSDMTYTNTSM